MALHRLTTLTIGVPDVATTGAFYLAFGLDDLGEGSFATRDGGEQLRLVTAPTRGPQRIGLGVDDGDDLGRLTRSLTDRGLPCTSDDDGLHVTEPVTGVAVDVTVAPPAGDTMLGATVGGAAPAGAANAAVRPRSRATAAPTVRRASWVRVTGGPPTKVQHRCTSAPISAT